MALDGDGSGGVSEQRLARLDLDVMLTEANRFRGRGLLGEAAAKCRQAIAADADYWQAYELMGDILRQQGRAQEAIEAYRWALKHNPERAALEDKTARACVDLAYQKYGYLWLQDRDAQGLPKRNPGVSALLSAVLPGLGQCHNRHFAKGVMVLGVVVLLLLVVAGQALGFLVGKSAVQGYFSVFFSGRTLYVVIALAAIWLYSVIDAAFGAG